VRAPNHQQARKVESARVQVEAYFDFFLRNQPAPKTGPRRRGRQRNWPRDAHIAEAVALAVRLGFHPHRKNYSLTDRISACSIVADALNKLKLMNITDQGVEKIWEKMAPRIGLRELSTDRAQRKARAKRAARRK
jgi:hypothetical protein